MNTMRNISPVLLLFACSWLMPECALAEKDIVVDVQPPPARIEHQPPHRDGYVWAPGYWEWTGHSFHWTSGTWISERRGHWVANHWDQMGNQWRYVAGHWEL
jgi:WXXGXW repeat (2 copies)